MIRLVLYLLFILFTFDAFGIKDEEKDKSVIFVQPEFSIGEAFRSNSNFPETKFQTIYSLSIGKLIHNPSKTWAVYMNYPTSGITISYTNYGNNQEFGSSYSVLPYISIHPSKKDFNTFHIRVGLGASFFTKHYDPVNNSRNRAIGSTVTWTFATSLYYNFYIQKHIDLNLGLSFIHHSNGHTQLPNFGLNSVLFSISSKLYLDPIDESLQQVYKKPKIEKTKQHFATMRIGIGMHEFGGPDSPTGGVKRAINIVSIGVGTIYKRVLRLSVGLTYRFYHQYYNYINNYQPDEYTSSPILNASNVLVYFGGELLLGHVGLDAEINLNLYKPFYKYHSELYETDSEINYTLKSLISNRLGLKVYLNNTAKNPKNNIFLGMHINANLGQADFSELSLGFIHRFNQLKN